MSKERLGVRDSVELLLKKADGTIISNQATMPINADYLRMLLEKMGESNTKNTKCGPSGSGRVISNYL